ncbi:MAG: LamG-like jellyroll fold domain-containing protein [Candidatus Cryptobacteroides sp.]
MKKYLSIFAAALLAVVGCNKENTDPTPNDSVTLNKPALTLTEGESATLVATASGTVTWSVDKSDVATVAEGVVTAVKEGEAVVTATCGTAKATCKVTVKAKEEPTPEPTVQDTALDLTLGVSYNYNLGKTATSDVWTAEVKFRKNGDWNDDGMANRLCNICNLNEKGIMLRFNDDGGKHVGSTEWGLLQVVSEATGNFYIGRNEGEEGPQKFADAEGGEIALYKFYSDKWYTLSFVDDGSKFYVYCNGELLTTINNAAYTFNFERLELGMSWTDGGEHDSKTGYPYRLQFKGDIAYVRFWTKALSESEIKAGLCTVDPKTEGLEVDFVFDQGEGTKIEDKGGNGYVIDFKKAYYYQYGTLVENIDVTGNIAWKEAISDMCE